MNGFERRRKEKMDAILQAAYELFLARGVKAVTIADIAAKAHVSQVTIYNYLGSKGNLAKQVFFELMDRGMSEGERLFSSGLSFREKCEAMFSLKMQATTDPTLELLQQLRMNDPDVQRCLEEYYRTRTIPWITNLIEQGKKEGQINSDFSTEAVLMYLEVFQRAMAQPGFFSALTKKVSQDFVALIFYGLFGKPDKPAEPPQ